MIGIQVKPIANAGMNLPKKILGFVNQEAVIAGHAIDCVLKITMTQRNCAAWHPNYALKENKA